jgi:hypothetical protein
MIITVAKKKCTNDADTYSKFEPEGLTLKDVQQLFA